MKEKQLLRKLYDHIKENELAGQFPRELIMSIERGVHPVHCAKCGGTDVEVAMWVRINDDLVTDDFGSWEEPDSKWCHDCQDHVQLIDVSTTPESNWEDNELQFARLLTEIRAQGFLELDPVATADLLSSMDLEAGDVEDLFIRADEVWELAKDMTANG